MTVPEYYWANYRSVWRTAHLISANDARKVDSAGELAACGQYLYSHAIDMQDWSFQPCKRCLRTRAHRAIIEGAS